MTTYTNVFGNVTLPPAEYGFRELTITADVTLLWPYDTNDASVSVAKIIDVSCAAGNIITVPDARLVSTGEDFLIRNIGAETVTLKYPSGAALQTIAAGAVVYFYLTENSTEDGEYGSIAFGYGAAAIDAATLVGYGIKAIGVTLNQSHPVTTVGSNTVIDSTYRAEVVVNNGGAMTISLGSAITLGNDFFFVLRNSGTGTMTIDADGGDLVDGQASLTIQPGESLLLFCSGTAWYSVGYGRSTIYQFTQLIKDVSAGGSFTLTATEAGNKLITFAGNPASAVTVIVPNVVSVYYLSSEISTAQTITVKTLAGSGVVIPQSAKIIAICDGTDVFSAQSVSASTSISLIDGSAAAPSLNFSSQTNTGLYKAGAQGIGVTVNGAPAITIEPSGVQIFLSQDYTQYDSTVGAPAYAEGRVFYDSDDHTLAYFNDVNGITVNLGQEMMIRVRNNTGSTILNGSVVYVTGAIGNRPKIALAKADSNATSSSVIGVVTNDVSTGQNGYVTLTGLVHDLNTTAWSEGTELFLSATVAGEMTSTRPPAPDSGISIGFVTRQHATLGTILVKVLAGKDLDELDDVNITAIADKNVLQYDSVATYWKNVTVASLTLDGTNPVGYLNIPQNSQSAAYTLVLSDAGKHILHPSADTTARIFTIPANASVAFPVGTAVTFVNQNAGGSITIAITTDTMRLAGVGTTGSRTLAANGVATALKITSTEWIISGTNIS